MITPIPLKGFGTFAQRHYLLLTLALRGEDRAVRIWRRFIAKHPQYASTLVK